MRGARLTAQVEGCQVVGRALRPAKINKIYFLASPQVQYSRIQTTSPVFKNSNHKRREAKMTSLLLCEYGAGIIR